MKGKKKSRIGWVLGGCGAFIFIILAACGIYLWPLMRTTQQTFTVCIPSGATFTTVKDSVEKYSDRKYAEAVIKGLRLLNPELSTRHGAYEIEKGSNAFNAARRLARGSQTPVRITINGFRTKQALADRVSRKFDFSEEEMMAALDNDTIFSPYGLDAKKSLAIFIDDSYELYWSSTPQEVVEKIGENYNRVWNSDRKHKAEALGLTPAEVMTVCSIVDEETNKLDEKGKIGRLYINRLDIGMKLQADPTVRYAVGDFTIRRVTGQHLRHDSPYNTYLYKGLPPSPIRTTSVATIDAVLNSEPSDYLYMCAREDFSGYHNFASTYEEHRRNAAAYQRALDARGIR